MRFIVDGRDLAELRTLMRWKSGQYHHSGWVDIFNRPWIVDVADYLFSTHSDQGAERYKQTLKTHDLLVAEGMTVEAPLPAATHRARISAIGWTDAGSVVGEAKMAEVTGTAGAAVGLASTDQRAGLSLVTGASSAGGTPGQVC